MTNPFEDPDQNYVVLVNHEDQHSLWPEYLEIPKGWNLVHRGSRDECLRYVTEHWTDMRPISLREFEDALEPPNDPSLASS